MYPAMGKERREGHSVQFPHLYCGVRPREPVTGRARTWQPSHHTHARLLLPSTGLRFPDEKPERYYELDKSYKDFVDCVPGGCQDEGGGDKDWGAGLVTAR